MEVGHSGWSRSARGRAVRRRPPDADRKCFEVLHDCGEVELVAGAGEPPQPHPLEAKMGLEVSKPHLDLLALVARSIELRRAHECAGDVAGILVDVSCDLAKGYPWTALRLERACIAVALGRQVSQHVVISDAAGCLEHLTGGADVDVALPIEREVAAGEGAVLPGALVPDGDLWCDAGADQPAKERAGAV